LIQALGGGWQAGDLPGDFGVKVEQLGP
jgi:hypothetical protein